MTWGINAASEIESEIYKMKISCWNDVSVLKEMGVTISKFNDIFLPVGHTCTASSHAFIHL